MYGKPDACPSVLRIETNFIFIYLILFNDFHVIFIFSWMDKNHKKKKKKQTNAKTILFMQMFGFQMKLANCLKHL